MKERILDLVKWILILLVAATLFYFVCPKYSFDLGSAVGFRMNEITGSVEILDPKKKIWLKVKPDEN